MKNNIIITLIALLFTFNSYGQEKGYHLDFQIEGLKDTVVNLSYFFGSNFYYRDTTEVDSEGNFTFKGDKPLEEGLYAVIKGQDKLFDFFMDEQKFSMETEMDNLVQEMEVEGSPENKVFFEYLSYLKKQQKLAAELVEKQKAEKEGSKDYKKIEKELEELDKEVTSYIEEFKKEHEGTFTVKFLKAMEYAELPKVEEGAKIDSAFQLQYLRDHAFDNIDFSDERMLRIPSYNEKILYFMNSLTYTKPDSIIKSIDYILDKAEANPEVFKYTLNFLTSHYQKSERMGTDAIFVHMAKNYYLNNKAPWVGDKDLLKIHERATALEPLLIGKKAPNIIVQDTAQEKTLELYDIDAKYTIVYIWSPECGHCKVTTPELLKVYHKYRDEGVEVFAIGNEFLNAGWKDFIIEHKLDWINGSDNTKFRSNFRSEYDVYSTPQTYLLDKDKIIIAKKMTMESLDKILEYQMEIDKKAEKNEQ